MILLLLWATLMGALAQTSVDPLDYSFDPELFRPHGDTVGYTVTHGASSLKHLQVSVGTWGNYSEDALVIVNNGQRVYVGEEDLPGNNGDGVLDRRGMIDLQVGLGLFKIVSLTVDLPIVLWQSGYELRHAWEPDTPRDLISAGPADMRSTLKAVIVDLDNSPVGVAVLLQGSFPTGASTSFLGEGGFTAMPMLIVEASDAPVRAREHIVRVAVNAGYRVREPATYQDMVVSNEFVYRAALGVAPDPRVELGIEAVGAVGVTPTHQYRPLEVIPSVKILPAYWVSLTGGVGFGVMPGLGAPDIRGFLGGTLQPSFNPKDLDRDKDGIPNKFDACENIPEDFDGFEDEDGCPEEDNDGDGYIDPEDDCPDDPEDFDDFEDEDGCPEEDNDGDGILDVADRCPNDPETFNGFQDDDGCPDRKPVIDTDGDGFRDDFDDCPYDPEDFDGFEDADGCPEPDNDGDGILDVVDACPTVPEDFDGVEDEDGCPDEEYDRDGDGILDVDDACPDDPETFNDFQDGDGCPDTAPPRRVFVQKTQIVITEKIYFDYNKATIKPVSFDLLEEIGGVILDHPEIVSIRVEGHTDSDGSASYNLDLSQRRAESVVAWLVGHGVEAERLEAVGYGEEQPIADNETDDGKATNRRVEFVILERE